MQCAEIESSIESVRERAKVSGRVLAEREAVISAAEAGLQVPEHRVDPLEFGHVPGFAATDDDRFMAGTDGLDRAKAGQPVGVH